LYPDNGCAAAIERGFDSKRDGWVESRDWVLGGVEGGLEGLLEWAGSALFDNFL
jgi:hypothetical protein